MINTGKFAGRTVIITGASRGIGKEIALKLAKDGANIVVAAKTVEPHPKLPGTIHTAVEDIEKAGGKGLACVVDVRDEESVTKAVSEAVKKFGRIDALVNNASAISLTGTLETTMKKFDLMHQINTRGTFLMSQKCIPYLKEAENAHILNISPPLNLSKHWFSNHVAYTMAKYGMSMCVLGMHEEFRPFKIAVNALWPKTAIWTAAMKMISGGTAQNECRKATIVADAAYAILSRDSSSYTGNFAIDEDILREEGIRDFDQYAIKPGAELMSDFFLSDAPVADDDEAEEFDSGEADSKLTLDVVLNEVKERINQDIVREVQAIFQIDVKEGRNIQRLYFDLKNGEGGVYHTLDNSQHVDVRFTTDSRTLRQLLGGEISATVAISSGKFQIDGNMHKALLFSQILKRSSRSKL